MNLPPPIDDETADRMNRLYEAVKEAITLGNGLPITLIFGVLEAVKLDVHASVVFGARAPDPEVAASDLN